MHIVQFEVRIVQTHAYTELLYNGSQGQAFCCRRRKRIRTLHTNLGHNRTTPSRYIGQQQKYLSVRELVNAYHFLVVKEAWQMFADGSTTKPQQCLTFEPHAVEQKCDVVSSYSADQIGVSSCAWYPVWEVASPATCGGHREIGLTSSSPWLRYFYRCAFLELAVTYFCPSATVVKIFCRPIRWGYILFCNDNHIVVHRDKRVYPVAQRLSELYTICNILISLSLRVPFTSIWSTVK